jgi:hypothetical protein
MDESGAIINDAVGLGDELTAIDKMQVRAMPVGDVVQRVAGAAGTLVHMTFRNPRTDTSYSITVLRHLPRSRNPVTSPASPSPIGAVGGSAPPGRPDSMGALEASAPGPIQQVTLSKGPPPN